VKTVEIETAKLSVKSAKPVEEKRKLQCSLKFDLDGRLVEQTVRDRASGRLVKHEFSYSAKGDRKALVFVTGVISSSGAAEFPNRRILGGDASGNVPLGVSGVTGDIDDTVSLGVTTNPFPNDFYTVYWRRNYDGEGRITEESLLWELVSNLLLRSVYTYDDKDRRKDLTRYSGKNELIRKYVYSYDDSGNVIERAEYGRDGSLISNHKYTYESDKKGNWIKRIASKEVTNKGKTEFVPIEVSYRNITYYQ
jgi:hypothetical protein